MLENISLSFKGIWSHKMRSFLTMLGIIVGIAAVIAVVSTISGTNEQMKENLIGDGSNTIKVELYQNGWAADFSYSEVPDGVPVYDENMRQKLLSIDGVKNATLYNARSYSDNLYYGNKQLSGVGVYGIDSAYFDTEGLQVIKGRGFSKSDYSDNMKVCIINKTVMAGQFDNENPIGQTIDISGEPFTVIGVVNTKSTFEPVINSTEDYYTYSETKTGIIYIPSTLWPAVFIYDEPVNCVVKANSTDDMTSVAKSAVELLNKKIDNSSDSTLKYVSSSIAQEASQLEILSSSTNVMLIGIASISLFVGGIGVMNIMLVSVTERTREIGLKKALGAKKRRIQSQFLTEAMILSGIGGILGVIVGIILSEIISIVAVIPVAISIPAIIIAVVFSMCIGIIFGMVPSIKASNLNPIDALRYE